VPKLESRRGERRIEGIVTIALMIALLVPLGALALRTTRGSSTEETAALRHAVVARELSRLIATPFTSLPASAGCTKTESSFPHTRCVAVTDLSPQVRRLMLVVTPTRGAPDTVVVDRAAVPRSPLSAR
jgi:hypothetical protein